MGYEYDIFISYKRQKAWTLWTREHLAELINAYLSADLGYEPKLFIDENIEVACDFVDNLAESHARSKILLAIFSADYFRSPWCLHELDLMVSRMKETGHSSPSLVVPVVVHDGDMIPGILQRKKWVRLDEFRIAYINRESPSYGRFSETVKEFCPGLAAAIKSAPEFDEKWINLSKARFTEVFEHWSREKTILTTTSFEIPTDLIIKDKPQVSIHQ